MKFPMPSFSLGMGIVRWAEELRKWCVSYVGEAVAGLDGRNGKDGNPGTSGCNCHDAIDLTVAGGGTTVLTDEYANKTVYVQNTGGGMQTLTLPSSLDGDYMMIVNRSLTGVAYRVTFTDFGTYGSTTIPILVGGQAIFMRDDGYNGWFYVQFSSGTAGVRP